MFKRVATRGEARSRMVAQLRGLAGRKVEATVFTQVFGEPNRTYRGTIGISFENNYSKLRFGFMEFGRVFEEDLTVLFPHHSNNENFIMLCDGSRHAIQFRVID